MTTIERVNVWLNVGDRLVLWVGLLALIALFWWHDQESETNSPTLISPTCVTTSTAPSVGQEKRK